MGKVQQLSGDVENTAAALAYGQSGADSRLARWVLRQFMQDNPDGRVIAFSVHRSDAAHRILGELDNIAVLDPRKIQNMSEEDRQSYLANLMTDIFLAADDDAHGPGAAVEYVAVVHRERDPLRRCSTHSFVPAEAPASGMAGPDLATLASAHVQDRKHIERLMQQNALLMGIVCQTMQADAAAKQARLDTLEKRDTERAALLEAADSRKHERDMREMQLAQVMRAEDASQARWDKLLDWGIKTGGPLVMDWIADSKRDPNAKPDEQLVRIGRIIFDLPDAAKSRFGSMMMELPPEQAAAWQKILGDINAAKVAADQTVAAGTKSKLALLRQMITDLAPETRKKFDEVLGALPESQRVELENLLHAKE